MFKHTKKAEMGVGTLIVFIAMLLVAAVAAGVLIQTSGALQEKALATGQQARSQISTNARVVEVSAANGQQGNLSDFQQIVKLSPGSDPIKLDQIIFTFNTKDATATLHYRENGVCEQNNQNGYNTWYLQSLLNISTNGPGNALTLDDDLDDDSANDVIYISTGEDENLLYINLSTGGAFTVNTSVNLSNVPTNGQAINVASTALTSGSTTYGYVTISGTQTVNDSLTDVNVSIRPYEDGEGYFTVEYEQQGTNHVPGNLQRGDIIRLCYEAPGLIAEDQLVRLNFIPKIGTPTLTQFVTPDVIATERVYLYP